MSDIAIEPQAEPKPNRYSKPRIGNKPWSRSGPGWFAKGVINAIGTTRTHNAKRLAEEVFTVIPLEVFRQIFPDCTDVTANEIYNRWHKGTAAGYAREHPDKHAVGRRYYQAAVEAVERGAPLSFEEIEAICRAAEEEAA